MVSNLKIKQYDYNKTDIANMLSLNSGKNWPYVYLIHDNDKLYVGETQSIYTRTKQHLDNKDVAVSSRSGVIETIYDDSFNKSAILDIEQSLIQLFSADNYYKLLNRNGGQSCLHNYYQKDYYHNEVVEKIWDALIAKKIAKKPLYLLKNLDIFKYSPFVSLTEEQLDVCEDIVTHMLNTLPNETGTFVVHGSAGTGKTVLSIYLLSILKDLVDNTPDDSDNEDYDELLTTINLKKKFLRGVLHTNNILKIGFVVPMTSLRNTLKSVFKDTGLSSIKVIGPDDVVTNDFDILFVDEAHRLYRRKNLTSYGEFDRKCLRLGLDPNVSNQLQWIMMKSKYTVLFYDECQSVKGSDITKKQFAEGIKMHDSLKQKRLSSQLRCQGGADYIDYVDKVLHVDNPDPQGFGSYQVALFDNVKEMIDEIKSKETDYGLSRVMAGYGWYWKTHGKTHEEIVDAGEYDIDIDGEHFIWNTTASRWICSAHAIDEVGCIHTTQGFDLNYAGLIFGPEIDYDPAKKEIIINRDKFFDVKVKASASDEELKQYIVNAYAVMMKRGIKGTYIYVVNKNLKEYLSKFFSKPTKDNN